jgi:hypothetical protein
MSTLPPEQPPPSQTPPPSVPPGGYPGLGQTTGAILPIPGNAELAVYFVIEVLFAIIWMASDAVNAGAFCALTAAVTIGYLVSRGIAKASRVLEQ